MGFKKHCLVNIFPVVKSFIIFFSFLFSILIPIETFAEEEYDEVPLLFKVEGVGNVQMQTLIQNADLYIPVADFFDFLRINHVVAPGFELISGFFINQSTAYSISRPKNHIFFKDKTFELKPGDLILTETNLYLKSTYFSQVFGLHCAFHFRSLSVLVSTKHELPVIRERRREQMRLNISRLKGEVKADTTIYRKNPFFRLGMADWSINSTQSFHGQQTGETQQQSWNYTRLNLALGANLAGGEANVNLNYLKDSPFTFRNQHYLWRYANNDNPALRQIMLGRLNTQATSSLFAPIIGMQLTNASTVNRKSFGSYQLSDYTEPNWVVELYINNTLVDYVQADDHGFFSFDVPLVYGNTFVKLHFYGPWGEERITEKNITIPFNFVPSKEIEYSVSAGMVEDNHNSIFSRGSVNYGVNRHVTIGGGVEYLSSVTSGPVMPFFNTSMNLAAGLIFSGEYTHSVRSKGVVTYRHPSDLNIEVNYINYVKGQKAIFYNYLEERRVTISKPLQIKNFRVFSRLALNQIVFPTTSNTNVEWQFSGSVLGVATNINNQALFYGSSEPYFLTNLSLSTRLFANLRLVTQAQYAYNKGQFLSVRGGVEKNISRKAFLNLSYEKNMVANISNIDVGFRYNFSFSKAGITSRASGNKVVVMQSARGGIMFNQPAASAAFNSYANVGKGGITLIAFLDLNNNGKRDKGEPKVSGLKPRVHGGRFEYHKKDTLHTASGLMPYTNYIIEVDQNNFQTIAWQIKNKSIKVTVEPNHFRLIEVPVAVAGEVSGMIYDASSTDQRGIGRIKINFYKNGSVLMGSTISEYDGYFNFLGLSPGSYVARIDKEQMENIKMTALPAELPFKINTSTEGDIVDDLEFFLQKKE